MKPLFIFSLPRSGSTWLQKMLGSHSLIATHAEPWILLPFFYSVKNEGLLAEYYHSNGAGGIREFLHNMPNGMDDFYKELHHFILSLYSKYSRGKEFYFLDKTPRYHLIIPEIATTFPEAKFIFLLRDPLSVIGSIMNTFSRGRIKSFDSHSIDMREGFENLSIGYKSYSQQSFLVWYEDLLTDTESKLMEICHFLEIPFESSMLSEYKKVNLLGKKGDHRRSLATKPDQGSGYISLLTPLRKQIIVSCLKKLPEDNIFFINTDKSKYLLKVKKFRRIDLKFLFFDIIDWFYLKMIMNFKVHLLVFRSYRRWLKGKFIG